MKYAICLVVVVLSFALAPSWAKSRYVYDVQGVAQSDHLNVRRNPMDVGSVAKSKKVGTIPWNAKNVLGTGVTAMVEGNRWIEVRYRDVRGWVNGRYLKPVAGRSAAADRSALDCSGTEPFWSLKIRDKTAAFDMMDGPKFSHSVSRREQTRNRTNIWVLTLPNTRGGRPTKAVVIRNDRCSDDMSEREYPYEIILMQPDAKPMQGCCSVAR